MRPDEYVAELLNKDVKAVKALMLEMYPKGEIGEIVEQPASFTEIYSYYDGNCDDYMYNPDTRSVIGGFLNRILGENKYLIRTKTPLLFIEKGRFPVGSHKIFPLCEDYGAPYMIYLKHYKFLPGDEEKFKEAIEKKNYANGSRMQKQYLDLFEGKNSVCVFYEGSKLWKDEDMLSEFEIMESL